MKHLTKLLLIAICFIFSCSNSVEEKNYPPTDFKLNLEKGKLYGIQVQMQSLLKQTINDDVMIVNFKINYSMNFEVMKVDSSSYNINFYLYNINIELGDRNSKFKINSSFNRSTPHGDILTDLTSRIIRLKISNKGIVKEMSGLEYYYSTIDEKIKKLPKEEITPMQSIINQCFSKTAIKNQIEAAIGFLPSDKISKNEKWSRLGIIHIGIPMSYNSTFGIKEQSDTTMCIEGNALINSTSKSIMTDLYGQQAVTEMNGTVVSSINFDKATGWIISGKIKQECKGVFKGLKNTNFERWGEVPFTSTVIYIFKNEN